MEIPNWQVSHLWLFQWSFFIHKKIIWHKLFFSFRWGNNIIISRCECMSHTHIKRLDGEWWKRNVKKIGILLYYIIQVQIAVCSIEAQNIWIKVKHMQMLFIFSSRLERVWWCCAARSIAYETLRQWTWLHLRVSFQCANQQLIFSI